MGSGGISFEHIWAFQLKCMMSNQFNTLIDAIETNNKAMVLTACLRLGWNDAFRHVSKNIDDIKESDKESLIITVCQNIVTDFQEYAKKVTTQERHDYIAALLSTDEFKNKFKSVKITDITEHEKALCFGHIQKMFNIAIKLLLCLILSAEHAASTGCHVVLCKKENGEQICLNDHNLLSFDNFHYSFDTADCPIDSIILKKIEDNRISASTNIIGHTKISEIVWSKLGSKEDSNNYVSAQNEISKIQAGSNKCNLCFDFENWNS